MQQLNIFEYYELGKKSEETRNRIAEIVESTEMSSVAWPLFTYRFLLLQRLEEPCALLPASQRAVRGIAESISKVIPDDIEEIFDPARMKEVVQPYQLSSIVRAIDGFETILQNDMPEMSTFAVAQIGIYRTEDLINRPTNQIGEELRGLMRPLALSDINEAGKCLAFRVPTAATFHLSRAIETVMNQYFESLTGKPYELATIANNWGVKTQKLKESGADEKITEFLVHIRKAYRNPVTHPEVIVEANEAVNFFSQATSVISMMLHAVSTLEQKRQPTLPGLESLYSPLHSENLPSGEHDLLPGA